MADSSLWVFGYGSLCWHPGFEYGDKAVGHIRHFARKFWQGNTEHRGTAEKVRVSYIRIFCFELFGPFLGKNPWGYLLLAQGRSKFEICWRKE